MRVMEQRYKIFKDSAEEKQHAVLKVFPSRTTTTRSKDDIKDILIQNVPTAPESRWEIC